MFLKYKKKKLHLLLLQKKKKKGKVEASSPVSNGSPLSVAAAPESQRLPKSHAPGAIYSRGLSGPYHRRSPGPPTGEARGAAPPQAALLRAAARRRAGVRPPIAPSPGPASPSFSSAHSPPPPLV